MTLVNEAVASSRFVYRETHLFMKQVPLGKAMSEL